MSKKKDASVPAPGAKPAKGGNAPKPDETDPEALGLMTEIEDELRAEEFKKLWDRYGTWVMAFATVVVLSVAGWQLWSRQVDARRAEIATTYNEAMKLAAGGQTDQALTSFAAVANEDVAGYAALAQLSKAALLAERGDDLPGVLAAYKSLMDDATADPLFRDLATVLYVLHAIDSEDAAALEQRLTPLLNPNNAFYYSAVELTAVLADKQGDAGRALQLADQLITDSGTPAGIRQRAEELAAVFKSHRDGAPMTASSPATAPAPTPVSSTVSDEASSNETSSSEAPSNEASDATPTPGAEASPSP